MGVVNFSGLELCYGDYIYLMTEKGEGFYGTYEAGYDNSYETFLFSNHSNGRIEVIFIDQLQELRRV